MSSYLLHNPSPQPSPALRERVPEGRVRVGVRASYPLARFQRERVGVRALALILLPLLVSACTGFPTSQPSAQTQHSTATAPQPANFNAYLDTLDRMAPGDTDRQAAELAGALAAAQQTPTASNRLRYAIALGAAGHSASNPVEAKRLITELLAGQHDLQPHEVALANACLREFDARVALYADIARQREDLERRLQSATADDDKRFASINAENTRLKKALADAERKLEAVAEMERTLLEQSEAAPASETAPRP